MNGPIKALSKTFDIFLGFNIIERKAKLSFASKPKEINKMNKKIYTFLATGWLCCWMHCSVIAQVQLTAIELHEDVISNFRQEDLMRDALERDKRGEMTMNGIVVSREVDMNNAGEWEYHADGSKTWYYAFSSPGALAMSVIFDYFYLPEGAQLFLYSTDKSWIEGPYTAAQNKEHHLFRTGDAWGDQAVLEYRQPAGVTSEPQLVLRGVVHYFRMIEDDRAERDAATVESDPCEVDANCPEGAQWENEKNAAVRLSLIAGGGAGLCSGTLVNNTAMDCKNYILTAMHCTVDSNDSDLLVSAARFDFRKSGCGSGTSTTTRNLTGLYLRADSNDNGGASGSDFALVELQDPIPATWDVYYAGWDATDALPVADTNGSKVVCLHHPAGDVLKISNANTAAYGNWQSPNKHWRVVWMETQTNWGVTEGGSSGSPIYTKNKHIIGTLTGGGSFCNTPTQADYYGRMAKHWTGTANPNSASQKLKVWLDPGNTGWLTFMGAAPGSGALPCAPLSTDEEIGFDEFNVWPTLVDQEINIKSMSQKIEKIEIFNANGQLVERISASNALSIISTQNLASGTYYVSAIHQNGNFATKKIVVNHR